MTQSGRQSQLSLRFFLVFLAEQPKLRVSTFGRTIGRCAQARVQTPSKHRHSHLQAVRLHDWEHDHT